MKIEEIAQYLLENGIDMVVHDTKAPTSQVVTSLQDLDSCNTLSSLEKLVRDFDGCEIKKACLNTVFADGNPNARIMIIGEAPGFNEDQEGIPFCGKSGLLLDKMFAAIGLTRKELYITNMVFWRPPGNRNPSTEEIEACRPFVEKHIALIDPEVLILAGSFAACTLLKLDQGISKLRGQWYDYTNKYMHKTIKATPIFHPSYLLRQPKQKALAWQDLQMIQKYLSK